MEHTAHSEYLAWVKTRKPGRYNLAGSGILPYTIGELEPRIEDIKLSGPGLYGYPPLQAAIAAHCDVREHCVVASSGTSMGNFLALAALVQPGDEVVVEEPVYDPLLAAVQFFRGSIKRLRRDPEANFQLPSPEDVISSRTRLVIITNFHNPTSAAVSEATLRHYGEVARSVNARILVDEVYLECMYEKFSSAARYGDQFIITGSLTKAYGLGGLRCGWVVAEPALAERMWRMKDLIDPGSPHPLESLSVIAFEKLEQIGRRAKTLLARNRALIREFFSNCDRLESVVPDFGTCIFPRYKGGDTERLVETLHERYETDVVPGRFFEMPNHFRLGIGGQTETLTAGLGQLRAALS